MLFGIDFLNYDSFSAIIFIIIMGIFLLIKRKNLSIQRIISLPGILGRIPILYIILLRTKVGLKFMDKIATKFREQVKLFGYCCIGIGFFGMVFISVLMVLTLGLIVFKPEVQDTGVSLILPFTNIPGYGYLSFWHFLISIFIVALIHEFAHGVVARSHNIKVSSSGVGSLALGLPLLPLAFVEPDEKDMKNKDDVIQYSIFSAGPVINILFALVVFLLFSFAFIPIENRMTESNGFSYTLINDSYPAGIAGMSDSTITALNGEKVDDFSDFALKMLCVAPGEEVTITTKEGQYSFATTSSPDDETKGFIGIRPLQNEKEFKEQYIGYKPVVSWSKGLLQWLYRLSFLVGLANLLPIMIVDGGRMFQIAIMKSLNDQKKANKIIGFIAIMFLMIIILGLFKNYAGGFF